MSRSISIWYSQDGKDTTIDTDYNDLLGAQQVSLKFWSLPILKKIGLERLVVLGYTDPIGFTGWEDLKELENEISILENEISILEKNKDLINFDEELLNRWIANLRYCFDSLVEMSPQNSEPHFLIG